MVTRRRYADGPVTQILRLSVAKFRGGAPRFMNYAREDPRELRARLLLLAYSQFDTVLLR